MPPPSKLHTCSLPHSCGASLAYALSAGAEEGVVEETQLPFRYLRKEDGSPMLAPGWLDWIKSDDCFF